MPAFLTFDLAERIPCFAIRAYPVIRRSHLNSTIFRLDSHRCRRSAGSKENVFVFRTDLQGTVRMVSDGEKIQFSVDRWANREKLYMSPALGQEGTGSDSQDE